jgi:pimeloyl-ACP methyl ester carboxylesterase
LGGHVILEALDDLPDSCLVVLIGTPPLRSVGDVGGAFLPSPTLGIVQRGVVSSSDADVWARSCTSLGSKCPAWLKTDFERTDPQARTGLVDSLVAGAFKNEWDQVAAAATPVTVVVGEEDPFINKGFFEDSSLLQNVWGNRVEVLAGAGHMAHWDSHKEFNGILAARIQGA